MSENNTRPPNGGASAPAPSPGEMQAEDGVDLREILGIFSVNKWLIAAVTAIVLALALLYAFLATPIYEADALIQIQEPQSPFTGGASSNVLSLFMPTAAPTAAEIRIMKSRSVLGPVVNGLNLNIAVEGSGRAEISVLDVPQGWWNEKLTLKAEDSNGRYTLYSPDGSAVVHGLVGKPAEGADGRVKILVTQLAADPGDATGVVRVPDQKAIHRLEQKLSIAEQGQDTGIVQLALRGPKPERAQRILNAIADQYIRQNVLENASQARQSLQFINAQLPDLKKQLDAAQSKLAAFQAKYGVINVDQQTQALLQEMTNLQAQLSQLQMSASTLKQRYTKKFPAYIALEHQIAQIQSRIHSLDALTARLPKREQGYLGLLRNAQVLEQLYTTLLAKAQDLQIAQAGTLGSARVVDYAVTPLNPVKPRKATIAVLGFVLGLFLGILAAFLRRALFRAVTAADELEQDLGLPVYAVIQHSAVQIAEMRKRKTKKSEILPLLAAEFPDDVTVEAIRSLRTSLGVALLDAPRKVICFIGAAPGVGKSFLTANIAHVMGSSGGRVLVIDADLRRGHLHRYFNTRRTPGLSAFLTGQAQLEDTILPSAYDNRVDFIPTGARPADPYTLISSPRFAALVEQCAKDYDFVLVDVPPVLAVAEGLAVARLASANLMIVKAGVQTRHEIRMAMNRMQQNDAAILGFVLNDLTKRASTYSYNRYGHSYQYKYEND